MSLQTRTTAIQNEIVRLYCTFQWDGILTSPVGQPVIEIIDTNGVTVIDNLPATQETIGVFYVDWYVPANLPLGDYYDRWFYQWEPSSSVNEKTLIFSVHSLDSYINFVSRGVSQKVSNRAVQLMNDLSNDFIYEAQHTPVYWEQGMRIQQPNQQKRIKNYYYFTLDSDTYSAEIGAVYTNNSQRFSVFQNLVPFLSSSSSSSESVVNSSSSSSSSSSMDSSSSSSSVSSSSSSTSSESVDNVSSSSSSFVPTTTTTTTLWGYKPILTCVGTGVPTSSGTLTKVEGVGDDTIEFLSFTSSQSRFSTTYNLAYKNWLQDPRPIVRLNNRIVDDGWHADYDGKIFFDGLMAEEDSINVAYQFAYFSPEEVLSFLGLGLKMMNSTPPASVTYNNLVIMPAEWDAPVLLYAAVTALKRLVFGLNWQEKAILFGKPDNFERSQSAIDNFKGLYTDYNTLWLEVKKDAKTRKLPGIAQYVTPEYTLPGGRSRWFRYLYKTGAGG